MPDTAETEWLDRHGQIWLLNADGTKGRKLATLATGTAEFQGLVDGAVVPTGTQLQSAGSLGFETLQDITTSASVPVRGNIRALEPGTIGNLIDTSPLDVIGVPGVNSVALAFGMTGGTDDETDAELRARILRRIQQPPMGGDQSDYEAWALAVPGVTRAWAVGNEMGIGTVSVRFMMDDLRADNDGFPLPEDITAVSAYVNAMRPVTVKECYVMAPLKEPIDFHIIGLVSDTAATRAAIESQIDDMLYVMASPGQTIYAAWKYAAVMNAAGVYSFDMDTTADDVMPDAGHMAVLGDIYYSAVQ